MPAAWAQSGPERVGNFAEVPYERLSDRSVSRLASRALGIRSPEWKHAESAHFIYHFLHSYVAAPVSVEAEFFYSIVARELGRDTAQWERKCHIYLFENRSDWGAFQSAGEFDPWTGGLQAGGELFILREAETKWKGETLGHEVTHLVLYRFLGNGIPLWLNEGFAEYSASRGYAAFWRARGYRARPRSMAVDPRRWIPVGRLAAMVAYPAEPVEVETFYHQSERLVRFLAGADKAAFLRFLEGMAQGNRFETALSRSFGNRWPTLETLDTAAREYASREHSGESEEP